MTKEFSELLNGPIWIWGARNLGPFFVNILKEQNALIVGIIDNDKQMHNKNVMGIMVYSPEIFVKKYRTTEKILLCCSDKNNESVKRQLSGYGINENIIYAKELDHFSVDAWGNHIDNGYEDGDVSKICNKRDFEQGWFKQIEKDLGWSTKRYHRKIWEFAFISKVLLDYNMLIPGKKGLGFAVGEEPLPSYFASKGASILATDLNIDNEKSKIWAESGQNASGDINKIWKASIISREKFDELVTYQDLDMNNIPDDIGEFDFCWSSCAIEHVGSLELSKTFLKNMIKVIKRGGIAVHTTEFNLWSNNETEEKGGSVIYRRKDLEELSEWFSEHDCSMRLSFKRGMSEEESFIPFPPYEHDDTRNHLNLIVGKYPSTSYGIVVVKN